MQSHHIFKIVFATIILSAVFLPAVPSVSAHGVSTGGPMIVARYFISKILSQGNNVYVLFLETNYGNDTLLFRKSGDYGHTFGPIIRLGNSSGYISPSMLAIGNNVYVIWADLENGTDTVHFSKSIDAGNTFMTTRLFTFIHPTRVELATEENNIDLVMDDGHFVFFSKSSDGGNTFSKPVNLSPDEPWSMNPHLAVTQNYVYVDWSNNYKGSELYFTKSDDYGNSFLKPVNLANDSNLTFNGPIQADGNNVYVAWQQADIRENFHYSNDIFFCKSDNAGTVFSQPILLSRYPGNSNDPHLYVNGNDVYVTFRYDNIGAYNATRMNAVGVTFARSMDGGNTFSTINLSHQIDHGSFGAQWDNLAVSGNDIYMGMTNNTRGGSTVYLLKSSDGGLTFDLPKQLFNSSSDNWQSTIFSQENNVYIGWEPTLPGEGAFLATSNDGGITFDNAINLALKQQLSIPEFPFAIPVLLIGTTSLIVFHKMKFRI